jgi:hypothetical protein
MKNKEVQILKFIPFMSKTAIVFSYLMVAGAIDWNICPEVVGMTKGSIIAQDHRPIAIEPLVIPRTSGQIDWNICPLVLGMTNGSIIARGHRPSAIEPLVIPRTKEQMFQSIASETIK